MKQEEELKQKTFYNAEEWFNVLEANPGLRGRQSGNEDLDIFIDFDGVLWLQYEVEVGEKDIPEKDNLGLKEFKRQRLILNEQDSFTYWILWNSPKNKIMNNPADNLQEIINMI